jgi:hypothetical protein
MTRSRNQRSPLGRRADARPAAYVSGQRSRRLAAFLALPLALACGGAENPPVPGASSGGALSGGAGAGAGGVAGASGSQAIAGGSNDAGAASGGASGGTGGAAGGGASAGSTNGGVSGAAASGGQSAGTGGSGPGGGAGGGEPVATRPVNVTAAKARHQHTFSAKTADPGVSFNDGSQVAVIDNRAPVVVGKLVLPFGGLGTNAGTLSAGGEFCARRGFHVLGIATFQDYDILSGGADFFGDARRSVFEGVLHTKQGAFADITMTPADGVAQRTQKALQYLHATFPDEDWGYFLQADGSVRWSDVIFSGMSHGGSNAARFAFLVRASRVVSLAAPRENLCTKLDTGDCGGLVATWLGEAAKTPLDRFFAITGKADAQHLQHLFALEKLGYVGAPASIAGAEPPYGGSHRLVADGGHLDFCEDSRYAAACNYVFGVPQENQAGTP